MSCQCCSHEHAHTAYCRQKSFIQEYGRMLLSGSLLVAGMILQTTETPLFQYRGAVLVWYLMAYLPVALPVLKEAWEELNRREYFNEFTLMFIATVGAFAIGEYPEGVAVMLFYSLGEHFQDKAVSKARRNIRSLLDIRPEKAAVIRNGQLVEVSPQEVQTEEVIEVKAGGMRWRSWLYTLAGTISGRII